MKLLDWLERTGPFVASAIVIGLIVLLMIMDCSERSACRDRGGTVKEYNKHTIWVSVSCGSGCSMLVPEEVSDWRCVDSASAPATSR